MAARRFMATFIRLGERENPTYVNMDRMAFVQYKPGVRFNDGSFTLVPGRAHEAEWHNYQVSKQNDPAGFERIKKWLDANAID